jgi:hypothetical protein
MVGIAVAVVIVLAGTGIGAVFGLRARVSDERFAPLASVSSGTTSTSTAEVSTTVTVTTIESGGTVSTAGSSDVSTVIDVPTTTASSQDAYLSAVDNIVAILEKDAQRIPQLATQINNTLPSVATSVDDELMTMLEDLDGAFTALSAQSAPIGFEEADGYLRDAANAMGTRIDATVKGVQAMRDANSVDAGKTYLDLGRLSRDEYQAAYKKFQDAYPIE